MSLRCDIKHVFNKKNRGILSQSLNVFCLSALAREITNLVAGRRVDGKETLSSQVALTLSQSAHSKCSISPGLKLWPTFPLLFILLLLFFCSFLNVSDSFPFKYVDSWNGEIQTVFLSTLSQLRLTMRYPLNWIHSLNIQEMRCLFW